VLYPKLLRPLLFALSRRDPELAHEFALALLRAVGAAPPLLALLRLTFGMQHAALQRVVWGLHFPNPLGLAAGFDKNALALPAWAALGFGFVELGTVTRLPQAGNPRPRLFRLPKEQALINRMGFNNDGADTVAARLARAPQQPIPIGVSLGKSKATPLEQAAEEYCAALAALYPYGSYFAINVSSPNTPGLRALQARAQLDALLGALKGRVRALAGAERPKPLLVKVAPDLSDAALDELLQVCADQRVDGLIATNTTIGRAGLRAPIDQAGGLSGRPLAPRALEVVSLISRRTGGALPIIGAGGIFGADDARRLLDAGATLLQVYTGFVYQGPGLVRQVCRGILDWRALHA
jgi:dihydroorotate dehydrogenase